MFCLIPFFSYFFIYVFLGNQTLQKQTSKITSQSVSAQQLLPHRLKNLNPFYKSYPKKCSKKNGSCKVRLINVLFLENLEQLQKWAEKKSREFPLEGPSPCGKTGLAPCRQSILSSCFVWSPFFLISLFMFFFGNQTLQKQTSKITSQSVSAQQLLPHRLKNLNPSYQSYPPKNVLKKMGVAKLGS